MEHGPIYLDNAATTPPSTAVVDALTRVNRECWGNPSTPHEFGRTARRWLEDAREFLRGTLGAGRLVFTSGGTEADVLGVTGAARCRPPGRVLVGEADHPAVLAQEDQLASSNHRLIQVPVQEGGDIDPEALFDLLGSDVRVVSLLHGHNELGTLAPLADLADTVRRVCPDAHVHVDLVQSYGKIALDLDECGVDSVAVSAHKLHGPRGIGFFACTHSARIQPLQAGGGQELGIRGGTENVAGAVGLAVAAEEALSHLHERHDHLRDLATRLFEALQHAFPHCTRLGGPSRLPHVLSMRIPGVVAETLQQRADARGVAFATGAACHGTGEAKPNHVLHAIGLSRRAAREVMRFSFGTQTTAAEVERAAAILIEEGETLQRISA